MFKRAYIPPMKPLPPNPTPEIRQKMYDEYVAECRRLNPGRFNADGSLKTWQQDVFPVVAFVVILVGPSIAFFSMVP